MSRQFLQIQLTDAERKTLDRAAKLSGVNATSTWLRMIGLREAALLLGVFTGCGGTPINVTLPAIPIVTVTDPQADEGVADMTPVSARADMLTMSVAPADMLTPPADMVLTCAAESQTCTGSGPGWGPSASSCCAQHTATTYLICHQEPDNVTETWKPAACCLQVGSACTQNSHCCNEAGGAGGTSYSFCQITAPATTGVCCWSMVGQPGNNVYTTCTYP